MTVGGRKLKLLKKFHDDFLILPREEGDFVDSRLRNKDLDTIPMDRRTWEWYDVVGFWVCEAFSASTMQQASSSVAMGLNAGLTVVACMVGNLILIIPTCLNGYVGAKYGINFPVLIRSSFGIWGSFWAVIVRGVICVIWYGIQVYLGAQGVQAMIEAIWPSFKTWHLNSLPSSTHITAPELISFAALWILSLPLLYLKVSSLRWLFQIKLLIMPFFGVVLFTWALTASDGLGPMFRQKSVVSDGFTIAYAFLNAITSAIGGSATFALNIPDLTRHAKKPKGVVFAEIFAVPISLTLTELLGAVMAASSEVLYGSIEWNPVVVVRHWDARAAKFFAGLFFAFAMTMNVAGNSVSFGNDLSNIFPRYINIRRGQFICAILGFAITPWNIENSAQTFMSFLGGYSIFLGAILGVMLTDYWIVRCAKGISLSQIYEAKGLYSYHSGFNYRAFVGFAVGIAPLLPGLAYNINDKLHINRGLLNFYSLSWLDSVVLSSVTYFVLSLIHPFPKYEADINPDPERGSITYLDAKEGSPVNDQSSDAHEQAIKWNSLMSDPHLS